jgi:hypothetical protein
VYDPLPFDSGLLKINQKANGAVGRSQTVETLRDVFSREGRDTLQFDHQNVFDKDVGTILSDVTALISHGKRDLGLSPYTAEPEFPQQSALINLLEEPSPQSIPNLEHSSNHILSQIIESAFIGVHRRLILLCFCKR